MGAEYTFAKFLLGMCVRERRLERRKSARVPGRAERASLGARGARRAQAARS